jgi:hypothetical protein
MNPNSSRCVSLINSKTDNEQLLYRDRYSMAIKRILKETKSKKTTKNTTLKKQGRPTEYNDEIISLLCQELATGKSLRTVCKMDGMPCMTSVFRWLAKYESFREQYARAKVESADALLEEILDIADDGTNDWVVDNDPENP